MTKSYTKLKHQVKSSRYYIFWGAATVAVMAGQIYVGNGYRQMSEKVGELTEMLGLKFEMELLDKRRGTGPYMPMREMIDPDDYIIWKEVKYCLLKLLKHHSDILVVNQKQSKLYHSGILKLSQNIVNHLLVVVRLQLILQNQIQTYQFG